MVQLTIWLHPYNTFKTQYGVISNMEWLEKEKKRIERDPIRKAEIRDNGKGDVALFVSIDGVPLKEFNDD